MGRQGWWNCRLEAMASAFLANPSSMENRFVSVTMIGLSAVIAVTAPLLGRYHSVYMPGIYGLMAALIAYSIVLFFLPMERVGDTLARLFRTAVAFVAITVLVRWSGGLASPYVPLYFVLAGVAGFFEPPSWVAALTVAIMTALSIPAVMPAGIGVQSRFLVVWPIGVVSVVFGLSTNSLAELLLGRERLSVVQRQIEGELAGLQDRYVTLAKIFDAAGVLLGTDKCFYFARAGEELVGTDGFNIDVEGFRKVRLDMSEPSISAKVVLGCEVIAVDDVTVSTLANQELARTYRAKSIVAVPIFGEKDCTGVLLFADSNHVRHFSSTEVSTAGLLGHEASLALGRAEAYEAIIEEQRRFGRLAAAVADGVFELDAAGNITFWNRGAERLTGYSEAEVIGENWHVITDCRSGGKDPDLPHHVRATTIGDSDHLVEVDLLCRVADGRQRWLSVNVAPLPREGSDEAGGFLCTFRDVTERKLRELSSSIDELTGVYNRRFFYERLISESERAKRFGLPLSLLMIDLDDFRDVNEAYGHAGGDVLLKAVCVRMKRALRKIDVLSRYGGDEFMVILPQTEEPGAAATAEKVRQLIGEKPVAIDGRQRHMTASIGTVTRHSGDVRSHDELIRLADAAMYEAKKAGKNTTRFAA